MSITVLCGSLFCRAVSRIWEEAEANVQRIPDCRVGDQEENKPRTPSGRLCDGLKEFGQELWHHLIGVISLSGNRQGLNGQVAAVA